jgi:hypothetical protein
MHHSHRFHHEEHEGAALKERFQPSGLPRFLRVLRGGTGFVLAVQKRLHHRPEYGGRRRHDPENDLRLTDRPALSDFKASQSGPEQSFLAFPGLEGDFLFLRRRMPVVLGAAFRP